MTYTWVLDSISSSNCTLSLVTISVGLMYFFGLKFNNNVLCNKTMCLHKLMLLVCTPVELVTLVSATDLT